MNGYALAASFLGTAVEFVEALTIVMAVGVVKGWKSSLLGMGLAVLVLTALVAIFGLPLLTLAGTGVFQLIIGTLMLLFGMRWLRKAILRYAGLKALHLEDEAYAEELNRQRAHGGPGGKIDWFGFVTSFKGVFLEGLESIFIVLTYGLAAGSLSSAIYGSLLGLVLVVAAGIALRKPLSMVPENTMKFLVGILLSAFGIFWVGEGIGVEWLLEDVSILFIAAGLLAVSALCVAWLKRGRAESRAVISENGKVEGSL